MAFAYAIQALSPATAQNQPHILGFATARTVTDDTLFEVWNASTAAGKQAELDFEGRWRVGNGTAAKPALGFISDPDSGIYRIGANNIGITVAGSNMVSVGTTGMAVAGPFSSTTATFSGAVTMATTLAVAGTPQALLRTANDRDVPPVVPGPPKGPCELRMSKPRHGVKL